MTCLKIRVCSASIHDKCKAHHHHRRGRRACGVELRRRRLLRRQVRQRSQARGWRRQRGRSRRSLRPKRSNAPPPDSVELAESQLKGVKVETIEMRDFPIEKGAVGSIDFNEDLLTQVFTPYQGRIIGLFAKVGDEVKKGQLLFTIDSPDLLQASSTLIAAAGVLELTTRNLARLKIALRDAGDLAEGPRAGGLRPADRRGRAARRPRRRAHLRQDRRRNGPHDRRTQGRPDPRRREPDFRPDHRAERRPGLSGAAGQSAGAVHRRRHLHHVDARQRRRERRPRLQGRPGGQGQRARLSEPDLPRAHHDHRVDGRSQHPADAGALRNRRSRARAARRHVRQLRDHHRRAGDARSPFRWTAWCAKATAP